ncbi:MAG: glutamate synthase large subunit [Bacteroidota bacterium]
MKEPSQQRSLYVPSLEHDACGIGFVAHLKGKKSHKNIADAVQMLVNMEHRGACGCDENTGDGAGILIQTPDAFFQEVCPGHGINLPEYGKYGVGMIFFPKNKELKEACRSIFNSYIEKLGLKLLGYRILPTADAGIGPAARSVEPYIEQVFIAPGEEMEAEAFERKLFVLRRAASHAITKEVGGIGEQFYVVSLSYKTITYKGQFRTDQVKPYFPDLSDKRVTSAVAVIHSRFSTNTFPKWRLAQPFRYIAHNGEINTIRGNVNWMKAKEALMECDAFTPEEVQMLLPICNASMSDSRNLDNVVELLVLAGRSLPHVMMMMVPEAWQENPDMPAYKREFYQYHATLMEPWDGPASISFTDGNIVGATLDRNGLRPSRYCLTYDDRVIMASEAGALPVDPSTVTEKGRLQPGKMFVVDMSEGRIIRDDELKRKICTQQPYGRWLREHRLRLSEFSFTVEEKEEKVSLLQRQQIFGITSEELKVVLAPMTTNGKEPIGSMGSDTPLAVLSSQSQHISHYFKQLFAQVSNPPIDPIRERLVMSLHTWIGASKNVLGETPEHCMHIALDTPVLRNEELAILKQINHPEYKSHVLDATFSLEERLVDAIDRVCEEAEKVLREEGINILIVSDREVEKGKAPIPALLVCGAIHHHLIRKGLRSETALISETGDAREVHHFATLIGFGVAAINPYLAFESIRNLGFSHKACRLIPEEKLITNYIKSISKGLLKVLSKMGISTVQSYHGAQIFEVLGLSEEVVDKCFHGSISRISGLSFEDLAKEILVRYKLAFPEMGPAEKRLEVGGLYQWKRKGEFHLFNPETIHLLQYATRRNDPALFKKYTQKINDQLERACTLRGLLDFKSRKSVPLEEVEPAEEIMKRFVTGAMSFGSLSHEAHSTLAVAMNRIGGKSNSGEGGEDPIRFERKPNGDWENSAIKQVASGRFGVTAFYLANAKELQIKMAQGAKPGEGGHLPGHKVDDWIGRVRYSTPGVGLISPPPHHDIYSIEDLAQLIFDLKNANRQARISVKLVSEAGVGTIAAGVAKAKADHILIAGHDGGTGASPLSSIRHAGLPWELGLAEAHQTLVMNDLRSRVRVQVDGQIRTGRDMAIATLLGAEEWGVATAALVVEGCIMMRKCHLNTCPVGVATQDPELRKKFAGNPDHVVNFFRFMAEDFREIMAELGFRTVNEMVGQAQHLKKKENISHWKLKGIDFSPILYKQEAHENVGLYQQIPQDHGLAEQLDWELVKAANSSLEKGIPVYHQFDIVNTNRSVGTILSNEITKRYKGEGLAEGTVHFKFRGSAGQSFGAFGAPGMRLELEGEANDYFGKGLSGGQLIVYPDKTAPFEPGKHTIVGNVAFYGATSGDAYIRGIVGERFCVRNSGVRTVVEGLGDHGCEYMTGGTVIVLGKTGRNFAAGMSGGVAYVYDPDRQFRGNCNMELVNLESLDFQDKDLIKSMVNKHYTFTGSRIALKLMTGWSQEFVHFVKVMPRDYKAALLRKKSRMLKQA